MFDLDVDCHSGYRGDETPRRLRLGGRCVEVVEVVDRWLAPDHRYFKIKGDDGGTYILRHDVAEHRWELTMFERANAADLTVWKSPGLPPGPRPRR